jgi:hypothetical protein
MDNPKIKAQVSLEFVISFVLLVLFAVLAAKVFIWVENTMVNRHINYEKTRSVGASNCVKVDFFNETSGKRPMNILNETK